MAIRGFWGARSREPPYRMNVGCFPNPNQKKSVSFAFGLSFPFGSWGGVARHALAKNFPYPNPLRALQSLAIARMEGFGGLAHVSPHIA